MKALSSVAEPCSAWWCVELTSSELGVVGTSFHRCECEVILFGDHEGRHLHTLQNEWCATEYARSSSS